MRLSKKIAAVALAAVMSVSLLTACGGTDAPSSSSPSSSSPSSSSPSSSSSGSGSSSSGSSSNSGTEDKEEYVDYKDSRTAKFYNKLKTGYTLGASLNVIRNGENEIMDMLVATNGNRVYQQYTTRYDDGAESQITLTDLSKRTVCMLVPDDEMQEQGKLGYYYSANMGEVPTDDNLKEFLPVDGLKLKLETEGNYYIETQSYKEKIENETVEIVVSYCFEVNSSVPKYVEIKESSEGKEPVTTRMTFTRIEYTADAKYMDFEKILEQYIDQNDLNGGGNGGGVMPLTAGLNIR